MTHRLPLRFFGICNICYTFYFYVAYDGCIVTSTSYDAPTYSTRTTPYWRVDAQVQLATAPGLCKKNRPYRMPLTSGVTPCGMVLSWIVAEPAGRHGSCRPSEFEYTNRPPLYSLSPFNATCIVRRLQSVWKSILAPPLAAARRTLVWPNGSPNNVDR